MLDRVLSLEGTTMTDRRRAAGTATDLEVRRNRVFARSLITFVIVASITLVAVTMHELPDENTPKPADVLSR